MIGYIFNGIVSGGRDYYHKHGSALVFADSEDQARSDLYAHVTRAGESEWVGDAEYPATIEAHSVDLVDSFPADHESGVMIFPDSGCC